VRVGSSSPIDDAIKTMLVDTASGAQVPLYDAASVGVIPAPNEIKRIVSTRKLAVICNVDGRGLGSVATELQERAFSEVTSAQAPMIFS